jgi:hypothetical protein
MASYQKVYDPGFLNVPGFGQSVDNPLKPGFYESMGIVKDLSVYGSTFVSQSINAGLSVIVGSSKLSLDGLGINVPSLFQREVTINNLLSTDRLVVNGVSYVQQTIVGKNGTFRVLAAR